MSSATRAKSNRQKQLDRLQRRLNSPRPDLPILRTAERPAPRLAGTAHPAPSRVDIAHQDQSPPQSHHQTQLPPSSPEPPVPFAANTPAPENSAPDTLPSALPEWARLLPLPNNLPRTFRSFLYRYIEENHKPTDTHESYLAAQIAQAMARKHLSASREPADQPNSLWLRYESLADRELKAAQRAWHTHQKTKPQAHLAPPALPPREARGEGPQTTNHLPDNTQHSNLTTPNAPQTHPSQRDRTFVTTNPSNPPSAPLAPPHSAYATSLQSAPSPQR